MKECNLYKILYVFLKKSFDEEAKEYNVFPFKTSAKTYKEKYVQLKKHFKNEAKEYNIIEPDWKVLDKFEKMYFRKFNLV